jgi:hypothetical protein
MSVDGEHTAQWAVRAEVIHHFYAYVQFDQSPDCIDMVNLDNADIEVSQVLGEKFLIPHHFKRPRDLIRNDERAEVDTDSRILSTVLQSILSHVSWISS